MYARVGVPFFAWPSMSGPGSVGTMAEPTIKDVLNAIGMLTGAVGRLEKGQAALDAKVDKLEDRFDALDAKVDKLEDRFDALDAKVDKLEDRFDALDAKVDKLEDRFDALDAKVDKLDAKVDTFRDVISSGRQDARGLEADVLAIHKGLVRAKVPYIPKDLPSQVRTKSERPSKPAKRTAPARRPRAR